MAVVLLAVSLTLAVLSVVLSWQLLQQRKEGRQLAGQVQQLKEDNGQLSAQLEEVLGNQPPAQTGTGGLDYQELYADLYVDPPQEYVTPAPKTVFLTFDDGPSDNTWAILDLLDQYGAKATFFVTGTSIPGREALLQEIVNRGHTLGVHTYSHQYKTIYASVEAYLDDFSQVYNQIVAATGQKPTLFRFPGGSVNGYNKIHYQRIIAEMSRRGFQYFDWNVDSGDASGNKIDPAKIAGNVIREARDDYSVVLLHDAAAKTTTVQALSTILQQLSAGGYTFQALTPQVNPPHFNYMS